MNIAWSVQSTKNCQVINSNNEVTSLQTQNMVSFIHLMKNECTCECECEPKISLLVYTLDAFVFDFTKPFWWLSSIEWYAYYVTFCIGLNWMFCHHFIAALLFSLALHWSNPHDFNVWIFTNKLFNKCLRNSRLSWLSLCSLWVCMCIVYVCIFFPSSFYSILWGEICFCGNILQVNFNCGGWLNLLQTTQDIFQTVHFFTNSTFVFITSF